MIEYQEIKNLLDNKPHHPTKFRPKNCVKMNDDACGTQNANG